MIVGRTEGLARDSAINLDHVQTVSQGRIGALIATLDERKMDAVGEALMFALGFPVSGSRRSN